MADGEAAFRALARARRSTRATRRSSRRGEPLAGRRGFEGRVRWLDAPRRPPAARDHERGARPARARRRLRSRAGGRASTARASTVAARERRVPRQSRSREGRHVVELVYRPRSVVWGPRCRSRRSSLRPASSSQVALSTARASARPARPRRRASQATATSARPLAPSAAAEPRRRDRSARRGGGRRATRSRGAGPRPARRRSPSTRARPAGRPGLPHR